MLFRSICLDFSESALYDLEQELKRKYPSIQYGFVLADIRNQQMLETIFEKYNPDFVYKLWSGRKIIKLIKEHLPQYEEFYRSLNPIIKKCDFSRFVIVYVYGGIYCDLDFYCKQSISYLTEGGENYFISEPSEHKKEYKGLICNGFFGACKQNDFVLGWIEHMVQNRDNEDIVGHTGPEGLYKYSKTTKSRLLLGNTCDITSIIMDPSIKFSSANKVWVPMPWKREITFESFGNGMRSVRPLLLSNRLSFQTLLRT